MSQLLIRKMEDKDLSEVTRIWNQVVEEGRAFPQTEDLTKEEAKEFFAGNYTAVVEEDGKILGMYILHPNNVGRVSSIANASYAVDRDLRGKHIGEKLVKDCLKQAKEQGYHVLQFNAVVASNVHAYDLYLRLGFVDMGILPDVFLNKDGQYEGVHVMYHTL
jgi:L-amino acid N-acyltransferase YncA